MKKAICKQLRKVAEQLPPLYQEQVMGIKVTGADLIKQFNQAAEESGEPPLKEHLDGMGKPINEESVYKMKRAVRVPVNHYENLKDGYKKYGPSIVNLYVKRILDIEKQLAHEQARFKESSSGEPIGELQPSSEIPGGTTDGVQQPES